MIFVKQSTAVDVVIGPFVDDTDGKTPETGLTISQGDCQLTKNAGSVAQKNSATAASHLGGGHYKVPLNTTDTGTLGMLRLYVNESGALPAWLDMMVMPANVWDSLFGADALQVDAIQIAGAAVSTSTAQLGVNAVQAGGTAWGSGAITSGSFAAGAINAAAIATGAIDADALAADAVDEILDEVVEGALTLRQVLRIVLAALAGKSTGGGSGTINFRDVADSKNRIAATVDVSRNRTAVTVDGS